MTTVPELKIHRSVFKALKLFDADRLRWLDEAAALGPMTIVHLGVVKMFVLTDPELARRMLVTDGDSWTRPPGVLAPIRVAIGENLFSQSDAAWAKFQPAIAPSFRKKALEERIATMRPIVEAEVAALPYDTQIDLELAMGRIALRVAAWVLLGEELAPSRADELARHQREAVNWVGRRLGQFTGFVPVAWGAAGREMKQHTAVLDAYADEVIARGKPTDDDFLGAMLQARPGGKPLTPRQLREHVLGLFLAGNETTATALGWSLVNGANAPEAWAEIRADPARRAEPFVTETLRLTPAVWGIPRTPNRAGVTLAGTRVRRGQLANVYLRGINRDPKTWADPLRFDPSRHERDDKHQQRALLPFGLGPRGCIGQHLAMAEMLEVLPALARHGDVKIDGPAREDPSFALRIKGGLTARFATTGAP